MAALSVSDVRPLPPLDGGHTDSILCVEPQVVRAKENVSAGKKKKKGGGGQGQGQGQGKKGEWTGVVATGGEDGAVVVWDPQRTRGPTAVVSLSDEVSSVAFHPEVTWRLFVSSGASVLEMDLRKLQGKAPVSVMAMEDDVSQICIHTNGSFLAACDDAGVVKVYDLPRKGSFKTLRKHTNICSTVQFRPHCAWELCSGGMDSSLFYVDFSNGSTLQEEQYEASSSASSSSSAQIFNPPFVHSLRFSDCGKYLGVALGNGSAIVYETQRRHLNRWKSASFRRTPVTQCHFLTLEETQYLVTTGDDGMIDFWDFQSSASAESCVEPPPCPRVSHGEKMNWLSCVSETVLVADITSAVRMYQVF